jgi:hypothetical protein
MTKRKIGFRHDAYNGLKKIEANLFDTISELQGVARRVMGPSYQIPDLKAFLNNPFDYLVDEFWKAHLKHLPAHLDRAYTFQNSVQISPVPVDNLRKDFEAGMKALGKYAPTITKAGYKSGLKEGDFDIYLDPAKSEEYDILIAFIDFAKILLERHHPTGPKHLQRFARNLMVMGNGDIVSNPDAFSE